eukprot:CAMPEP_0172297994 /NCGR_PEP_ID=MMETSP1058-20130122/830_1 /TAXON_ID=83371 /ORGANISM="Detonula confervacea, Strain CCMP 353" /LENGTH=261 /DNA_ID=CAMNT_0013007223 /DNA_START=74 /DNA_END=859 /DNA_ORIENTATION=-
MPSYTSLLLPLLASSASAFMAPGVVNRPLMAAAPVRSSALPMAIDYNDPAVMEQFTAIQTMEYDDVVEELAQSGVRAPADMGDMDVKLMLVELRTVTSGGGGNGGSDPETPPSSYGSVFEEYLWTKPVFKELYEQLKADGDHNKMNVAAEYCNEPVDAKSRYYAAYKQFIDDIDAALTARAEVKTNKVQFAGFPANMGEAGLKMTLEAVGEIEDMACSESDDGVTLVGEVTFGSIEIAKAAIEQYDGMDMGVGDTLKMISI